MVNEQIYDEQIYPLMAQIIEICKEHQIGVCAQFQYVPTDPDEGAFGHVSTIVPCKTQTLEFQFVSAAIQARGNVDAFAIWAVKYGREHGHNSVFLANLERMK